MPSMDIKVSLKEGMKIAPIDNREKEYILIKSSEDKELYLLHDTEILKLADLKDVDTNFICTDLSAFENEVKVIETGNKNFYLMENDFCIYTFISNELDDRDTDFTSLDLRVLRMTREDYMIKKGKLYYLKCRDVISQKYKDSLSNLNK